MPNRVCEQMVRFAGNNLIIRVWVTANQNFDVETKTLRDLMETFKLTQATPENMRMVICEIEKLDNIAAAEVLDRNGDGLLLYPDWN